jgi:hypothetical protein
MMAPFLLISEARGEFLVVEDIRVALARRGLSTLHVTASAADVTEAEATRDGVTVLERHPAFEAASQLSGRELRAAVDREQERLDINLRRLWKADLRSWRRGWDDDRMARLTVGYLAAWRDVLAQTDRVAGGWGEDGGHLVKRTGFLVSAENGIPLWFVYVAPLRGRLLVLDNPLNRFRREDFAATEPTDDERLYAHAFLDDLRASRVQFATPRDLSFGLVRVARFARLLADAYVKRPPGSSSLHPWYFARAYARQRAMKSLLRPFYRGIGDRPFVFFPIHAGFDAQISIRAPQWENQLALVEHIASSVPYGYELAVKEHPFEVGALPAARLARLLRRHPEIRMLEPSIHAHAVLRRCDAVATVNSTTGYEALFKRPVVTLGHGPYRGLGLTEDVDSPFETPQRLMRALAAPGPGEEDVERLVAFLLRNSRPGVSLAYDVGAENVERHADILAEFARR